MSSVFSNSPGGACPASAVVLAVRAAQTPLALADTGLTILCANAAFASLVGSDAAALAGRSMAALTSTSTLALSATGGSARVEIVRGADDVLPAALSAAPVRDASGRTMCLLCSLVDARGDDADAAIARDATLLADVARAAGELMGESAAAAHGDARTADDIALDAMARADGPSPS